MPEHEPLRLVADRTEGEFAVVQDGDGTLHNIPLSRVCGDVKSGFVLTLQADGMYTAAPPASDDAAAVRAMFDALKR